MTNLRQSSGPLRHRNFRLFLGIRFLLTFAAQMQTTVLGFYIYELTHSKIAIAFIGLSEVIPALTIALYGGHVTDKSEKRGLLLKSYGAVWLAATLMFIVTLPANPITWLIYALLFCNGIARAFYEPALFVVYTNSIPKKEIAKAALWNNLSWQTASITGPLVGGFLYAFTSANSFTKAKPFTANQPFTGATSLLPQNGISLTLAAISLLLLAALTLIFRLSRFPAVVKSGQFPAVVKSEQFPAAAKSEQFHAAVKTSDVSSASPDEESLRKSLAAGFHFVFRNKVMLYAMSLDLFSVFFGGVSALLPIYALDILHVGAQGLGVMRMTMSAGAALTMVMALRFPPTKKPWRNLLSAVGGFGCCIIAFGLSSNYLLSLLFLFGQGAFDNISVLIRTTLMPLLTPEDMRGRVSAVNGMFIASSAEIGDFESGTMASLLGTVPAVLLGGCLTIGVVIFTLYKTRSMISLSLQALTATPPAREVTATPTSTSSE